METRRYTIGEEVANSVTHGIGVLLSLAGVVVLLAVVGRDGGALAITSCAVFGSTLVMLYSASTLYHAVPSPAAKQVLRVLDHSAIYLLIAGTYTPLVLLGIGGGWGWVLFATVWSLAAVGVVTTVVDMQRFKVLSMVLYLAMGWLVVIAAHRVLAALSPAELALLVVGGLCYTGGLAFYAWRSLPYSHSVWHSFVLAGSVLHFAAVLLVVSP